MANVDFKVRAKTKEAEQGLNRLDKAGDKLASTFKAIGGAVVAGFAINKVFQGIKAVTGAASIQEDAVNSMNQALRAAGDFSAAASQDIQRFASDLQSVTTIGDETTLQMISLAKTFGLSNQRAKDLVKSAAELSAATGMSLESAVRNLGKTMSGLTGELGESLPAVRNLTEAQLKAGEAIDLVANRFAGSAAAKVNTFSGSISQLSNTFGDLQEEIGFVITKNPVVIRGIQLLTATLSKITKTISGNRGSIFEATIEAMAVMLDTIPTVIRGFDLLTRPMRSTVILMGLLAEATLSAVDSFLSFTEVRKALDGFARTLFTEFSGVFDVIDTVLEAMSNVPLVTSALPIDMAPAVGKARELLNGIRIAATESGDGIENSLTKKAAESVKNVRDQIAGFTDTMANGLGNAATSAEGLGDALREMKKDIPGPGDLDFVGPIRPGDLLNKPFTGNGPTEGPKRFSEFFIDALTAGMKEAGAALSKSFSENVGKGADGGKAFGVSAATQTTNFLGEQIQNVGLGMGGAGGAALGAAGGLLGSFGPLLGELAGLSKEEARERAKQFADGLVLALETLVENVPVFIEALAEKSDVIITALVANSPKIVFAIARGLINAFPIIVEKFAEGVRFQINTLTPEFKAWASEFGAKLDEKIRMIGDWFKQFLPERMNEGIDKFIEEFKKALYDPVATALTTGADMFMNRLIARINELNPFRPQGGNVVEKAGSVGDNPLEILAEQTGFALAGPSTGQPIQLVLDGRVLAQAILDLNSAGARLSR